MNSKKEITQIGYIQRGLPACDRQAFAQGLYYIIEEGETLKRSFDFRNDFGVKFPSLSDHDYLTGLGYKFAAGILAAAWPARGSLRARAVFAELMSSKNNKLAKLMQPQPIRSSTWCVIL